MRPATATTKPIATSEAMNFLWSKLTRRQYSQLGAAAVSRGLTAKEYVGALAARKGLRRWLEHPREGNC